MTCCTVHVAKKTASRNVGLLRRMKRTDITSHGFRSTFRDWAAERGYQDAVAEAALAHTVPDAVVAAYRRTTFFELRKKMMDDWATFATSDPAKTGDNVVEMRAAQ
jgi:integrase